LAKGNKKYRRWRFTYRVVPGDTSLSWLHEGWLPTMLSSGRMPRYMPALDETEMRLINTWIMNGARDLEGNPAQTPNTNILVFDLFAITALTNVSIPANRIIMMRFPHRLMKTLLFISFAPTITPVTEFKDCEVKFSTNRYDFSSATSITPAVTPPTNCGTPK
jgi:hypothetical protein